MPITLVRKAPLDPIQEVAARLQGRLRKAYLDAIAALQNSVDMQALADALAKGDHDAALRILGVDTNFASTLQGKGVESNFKAAVQDAYQAGGKAAVQALPDNVRLGLSFDLLNPRAIDFIQSYSFALIQDISHEARQSIRQVLLRAFKEGGHPFSQAREIRDSIGLTTHQEAAVANYRKALENNSRIALRRQLRDRRHDGSVSRAIRTGQPLDQAKIDKLVARYRQRYVAYRATTIARTECLLPETFVDTAVVRAAFRRWYDGPVVTLMTQGGLQFTTTPNHPMLTQRGWVGSGEIAERDYLICDARQQSLGACRNVYQKAPPASIGEIFDTLQRSWVVKRTATDSFDFHGDGRQGNVDTAASNGELSIGQFAPLYQPALNFLFSESNFEGATFCCLCKALLPINQRVSFGFGAHLCFGCSQDAAYYVALALVLQRKFGHRFAFGIPGSNFSHGNIGPYVPGLSSLLVPVLPGLCQASLYSSSMNDLAYPAGVRANSHLPSNLGSTQSAAIKLDRVLSVSIREFSGHVYNLETPHGYFTIDGAYTGNTIRAANHGQREIWRQARDQNLLDPDTTERVWVVSGDANTCDDCDDYDGESVGLDEEFDDGDPPLHPNCVIAGTQVWAENVLSATARKFEGDVIVLRTASGNELTCTPNHPILTNRGWVPAKLLDVGSDVVCRLPGKHVATWHMNNQYVPAKIEDVVQAFRKSSKFRFLVPKVAPKDFHGDGTGSKIAVVYTNRLLRSGFDTSLQQQLFQFDFSRRAIGLHTFNPQRMVQAVLEGSFPATNRVVHWLQEFLAVLHAGVFPAQCHYFGVSAQLNTLFLQNPTNYIAADSVAFADSRFRPTGFVFADHIVNREVRYFKGHVYNLETASGEYTAESIITHNCRCGVRLEFNVTKRDVKGGGDAEAIEKGRHNNHKRLGSRGWLLLQPLHKADWDESKHPRGEHGRFGSGSTGEGPEAYHGTAADVAQKILDEGLKASPQYMGERFWVFTSVSKQDALEYGQQVAAKSGSEHVGLVVVDLQKSGLHPHQLYPEEYRIRRGMVKPEHIKRIEIYKADDLSRPVSVLHRQVEKADELYVVVPLDPRVTKADWDESQHPRDERGRFGAGAGKPETVGPMTYREPAKPEKPFETKLPPDSWQRENAERTIDAGRELMKQLPGFVEARERAAWAEGRIGRIEKVMDAQWRAINRFHELPLEDQDKPENRIKWEKATKELDDATKRLGYAQKRLDDANEQLRSQLGAWMKGAVGETRHVDAYIAGDFGTRFDPVVPPSPFGSKPPMSMEERIRGAVTKFEQLTGGASGGYGKVTIEAIPAGSTERSHFDPKEGGDGAPKPMYYMTGKSGAVRLDEYSVKQIGVDSVVIHELGHWFEEHSPDVHHAAQDFLVYRTEGEKVENLNKLTGRHYRQDEEARPDKFIDPYVGKNYGGRYTEVVSMGFQYLHENAGDFYNRDPNHFLFTVGVIKQEADRQRSRK